MPVPTFDIFRGSNISEAVWVKWSEDLASAIALMRECAELNPGPYFIFDSRENKVVATVDTSSEPKAALRHALY
jgi:hypothetical protein